MSRSARDYLLVPAGGAGEGMGHLMRCLRLSRVLEGSVEFLTSYMDAGAREYLVQELARGPGLHDPGSWPPRVRSGRRKPGSGTWS